MSEQDRITTVMRIIKFITEMSKRDLLLIGFIGMFFLSLGVLTGYIPSPVLTVLAQQEEILDQGTTLIELGQLQLYLARENCINNAKTDVARARCDRQSIREALLGSVLSPAEMIQTTGESISDLTL